MSLFPALSSPVFSSTELNQLLPLIGDSIRPFFNKTLSNILLVLKKNQILERKGFKWPSDVMRPDPNILQIKKVANFD